MSRSRIALLSLGGSLVVPNGIDTRYLKKFSDFIHRNLRSWRFIVVVGGGRTARAFQAAVRGLGVADHKGMDWMGLYASRLNAQLVRLVFSKYAHPAVLTDPLFPPKFQEAILVAAGYKPGRSTDWVAVKLAQHYGAKKVINLTNIDHVYDRDPRKSRNAKPLKNISWTIYRKIAGSRWSPGLSLPFDPVASKLAQSEGIEVDIINGKKLQQVQRALEGKAFKGTRIF